MTGACPFMPEQIIESNRLSRVDSNLFTGHWSFVMLDVTSVQASSVLLELSQKYFIKPQYGNTSRHNFPQILKTCPRKNT